MLLNELQIALIGAGAAAVLGVWAYNRWQIARLKRKAETLLPETSQDPLRGAFATERAEPTLAVSEAAPVMAPQDAAREDDRPATAEDQPPAVLPSLPAEWADEAIDVVARLVFERALAAEELMALRQSLLPRLSKPSQWFVWEIERQRWRPLTAPHAASLGALAVTLQLVDRRGPLDAAGFAAFVAAVEELARRCAARSSLPEANETLARAAELDRFCATVDLQLALRVMPAADATGFAAEKVRAWLAECVLRQEGSRFVALDADERERFSLLCHDAQGQVVAPASARHVASLVFALDVPRVADGPAAFDALIETARAAATRLGGELRDGHGRPLPEATLAAIRGRIAELQANMRALGILPGDLRALRLFS